VVRDEAAIDDAGADEAEPPCTCPPLPATCSPPVADTPAFGPDSEEYAAQLFDVLACAGQTLHLAMYELNWPCIVDALLARLGADEDLVLRLVLDDERCPRNPEGTLTCDVSRLEGHPRVTIVQDDRAAYMHHKFAIADGARVWVSSGNLTRDSLCSDYNNSIVVERPGIVAAYEAGFQRMFTDLAFGPQAPAPPVSDAPYTAYFGPESPMSTAPQWFAAMIDGIGRATASIEVMIYAWTRTEISDALVAAAGRGVAVRALVGATYADDDPAQALLAAGIPIRKANVHSKFLVLDGATVVTGSANWSANAWENNENSLWIADGTVAAAYRAEFERAFALAEPVTPPEGP
jgi:phosphatidylserine/phosphatidylglycerophosphate/cardiolipin synthase-like enzyme